MQAKGSFEVTMQGEPPYEAADGISLSRASFDKQFSGALTATSKVQMLAARTATPGSAAYVALERIVGTLDGKAGSFVVIHSATMNRGTPSLQITIVPDSGTGELATIAGTMQIDIVEKKHFYTVDYTL